MLYCHSEKRFLVALEITYFIEMSAVQGFLFYAMFYKVNILDVFCKE